MNDVFTKIVLLRHGESLWNKENRFTGWTDIDLADTGIAEAHDAAKLLMDEGFDFDLLFTSTLKRAIRTAQIILDDMDRMWLPVKRSTRLNEKHYGALQGLNKKEVAEEYGAEQVQLWRRSYDTPAPALEKPDPRHPSHFRQYSDLENLPDTECLKDTVARFVPYWEKTIAPEVKAGKRIIIAAHGNSLRALVKYLDNISDDEIVGLNIPTGIPLVYELDKDLKPIRHYYLGDPEAAAKKAAAVAAQASVGK